MFEKFFGWFILFIGSVIYSLYIGNAGIAQFLGVMIIPSLITIFIVWKWKKDFLQTAFIVSVIIYTMAILGSS